MNRRRMTLSLVLPMAWVLSGSPAAYSANHSDNNNQQTKAEKAKADQAKADKAKADKAATAADNKAAAASASAAAARSKAGDADSKANAVMAGLRKDFETSPDYRQAADALKKTHDDRQAAEDKVRDSLGKDPEYVTALKTQEDAKKRVENLRNGTGAPSDMATASADALKADSNLGKLFDAAAANSPEFVKAQAAEKEAGSRMAQLDTDFQNRAKNDPKFIAANRADEEARVAAQKSAAASAAAANAAANKEAAAASKNTKETHATNHKNK